MLDDKDKGAGAPDSTPTNPDEAAIQAYKRSFARSGGIGRAQALPADKRVEVARVGGVASGAARRAKAIQKAKEQGDIKTALSNATGGTGAKIPDSKTQDSK